MQKIMFSDAYGLTLAVLEGRKTVTRRIIPASFFSLTWDRRDNTLVYENEDGDWIDIRESNYARYKVGEVVAVAQRYSEIFDKSNCVNPWAYEEDDKPSGWTNKMFVKADLMPHQIQIDEVFAEQLQDISPEDCLNEGVGVTACDHSFGCPIRIPFRYYVGSDRKGCRYTTPREAFSVLIDKISGKGTWEANPFVLGYRFHRLK